MMKQIYFAFALLLAAPVAALAQSTPETEPVAALNTGLIAAMKAGSAGQSFQARYQALDPIVTKAFNLPVILQNSVGFMWSTIPADQQQQLATLFEQFTVASYVNGFSSYGNQQIQLLPDEKTLGAKKIVETQIVPGENNEPTRLDYVMAQGDSGWQATDVLLNGTISKVAVQQSDFSSLVTSGNASQLISALKKKISTLSNGAMGS